MKLPRSRLLRFLVLPLAVCSAVLALGVAIPAEHLLPLLPPTGSLVIDDVSVVDVGSGRVHAGQTIVISGSRIIYAGTAAAAPAAVAAHRVSGKGRFAIPGLWDMHIHTVDLSPHLHLPLLLANGVTSVRDMGDGCSFTGDLDCRPVRPTWHLAGPRFIGSASFHVEEHAPGVVGALKTRGDAILKLQLEHGADPAQFYQLTAEGHAAGLQVAGHLPSGVDMLDARLGPLNSIEHDDSLLPQCSAQHTLFDGRNASRVALLARRDAQRCAAVLGLMARRGIAYTPTHVASSWQDVRLLTQEYRNAPELRYTAWTQRVLWRMYAGMHAASSDDRDLAAMRAWHAAAQALTRQAQASGVRVLAGSDAIDAYTAHGFSLHDELAQLVAAGLTPTEALRAATLVPATHAGRSADLGTIAAGKLADIVLLRANPLVDIAHTRAIDSVIVNGQLHERGDLDRMLQFVSLQASSFSMNAKFLWAMIKPW